MEGNMCSLTLTKGKEIYIFRCKPGEEVELLDAIIDQAEDFKISLDGFDATLLISEIAAPLITQANKFLGVNLGMN